MCQAFEGEQSYLLAVDRVIRKRGYDAFHEGIEKSKNPESSHSNPTYDRSLQWKYGWETASEGRKFW